MAELACSEALGVVVIGRNEGERLARCLRSISARTRPTVYVDSGSTDQSLATARELGASALALDPTRPFTAARGREEGWRALVERDAALAYVQFVDGDCEVDEAWLSTAIDFMQAHPDAGVVCGRRYERFPAQSLYNAICDEEWNTPVGLAASCGGDALMRVAALRAVEGFDPEMQAGEEPELCSRLRTAGWKVWRIDAPMTIHDAAMSRFSQWWTRARRSGAGYAQAWGKTAGRPERLYTTELTRSVLWAGVLPLASVALALAVNPLALALAPVAWTAQFARLSLRVGWRKAGLSTLGKLPELMGAIEWWWQAGTSRKHHAASYK